MFCGSSGRMLASMSEIDRRADAPLVDWSELGVSGLLPTGTVTLLLADVEGSTRLWETQPNEMTAALGRLNKRRVGRHRRPRRRAPGRAGRGRQLRGGVRPRIGRGGGGVGNATRAAGADPAEDRGAHRRNPAARRRQLRRPDHQPHRAAARSRVTAAKPCSPAPPRRWCSTGCLPTRGCPIWAPTRCVISPAPSGWSSCAIPMWSTSSRRCGSRKLLLSQHLPVQLTSFVGRDKRS